MSANVSPEERHIYWMLAFGVLWVVAWALLTKWLAQPLACAILAFVWILVAPLLPGARRLSAAKTLGLAVAGSLLVFAAVSLVQRI